MLLARQWLHSHAEAEEAVQDALLKVWKARGAGEEPEIVPLLFTAVKTSAIDRARSRSRREKRERKAGELLYEEREPMFEDRLEQEERRQAVEAAMNRLPEEQREVLVMKLWSDMTFDSIGRALGISPNTAASRYRYALDSLRGILAPLKNA